MRYCAIGELKYGLPFAAEYFISSKLPESELRTSVKVFWASVAVIVFLIGLISEQITALSYKDS